MICSSWLGSSSSSEDGGRSEAIRDGGGLRRREDEGAAVTIVTGECVRTVQLCDSHIWECDANAGQMVREGKRDTDWEVSPSTDQKSNGEMKG